VPVTCCSNQLTVPKEDAPPPPCTCTVMIVAQETEEPESLSGELHSYSRFICPLIYCILLPFFSTPEYG
jgi:hypothetical protein